MDWFSFKRKLDLLGFILFPGPLKKDLKSQINKVFKRHLTAKSNVHEIQAEDLFNWNSLELRLSQPTTQLAQTSKIELLILVAYASMLKPGENFLEIGTYDGNTTRNIALNIHESSKVITVDLPEGTAHRSPMASDDRYVHDDQRAFKKYRGLPNVQQIYENSTKLDFSPLQFQMAFIDGGHDYKTVKSDTVNVLKYLRRPGVVLWHDYEAEGEVADYLHELSKELDIFHIMDTSICMAKIK